MFVRNFIFTTRLQQVPTRLQQQRSAMPPKQPGPIVENTVKRPRSQFPLNRTKAPELEQAVEVTTTTESTNELAEIHTLACMPVTGQRRKQYRTPYPYYSVG